jgi:hypothetical protein
MGECQCHIFSAFRLAIAFVFLCLSAQADVIFSNVTSSIGAPALFVCNSLDAGCDQDCGPPCATVAAAAFTPTADYVMTDAEFLLEWANYRSPPVPPDNSFSVDLYSSSNGLPDSLIESIGSGLAQSPAGLLAFDLPAPISLTAGTQYWVVLIPSVYVFDFSPSFVPGISASYVYWIGGGSSSVPVASWSSFNPHAPGPSWASAGRSAPQFEIDGTPVASVPEPSSFPLIALLAIFCYIAKTRSGGVFRYFRPIGSSSRQ